MVAHDGSKVHLETKWSYQFFYDVSRCLEQPVVSLMLHDC